jgi:hypothetical protein
MVSVSVGPYPLENSFFPDHLIIPVITVVLFSIILYVINKIKKRQPATVGSKLAPEKYIGDKFIDQIGKKFGVPEEKNVSIAGMKTGDILSLVGLIGTIAIALVAPFSQLPILDYNVVDPNPSRISNAKDFYIVIQNFGTVDAEHVLVSLEADNVKFLKFTTSPFMSKHFNNNTTTKGGVIGKAVLEFDSLPP